jgi:integrase/recombinase XerD
MSIPKTLTPDQCESLLEELRVSQGTEKQLVRGIRNFSMGIVMLESGVRVAELCSLRVDDLWFADQPVSNLVVRKEIAKNKKERQIPISVTLRDAILLLDSMIWSTAKATYGCYAFFARAPHIPLSTRSVERVILWAGQASLNIDVTPHMLRHTFGSRMMRKTNARVVQALLGHSSLQSTQIYMHPNSEDLKKAIDS